MRRCARADTSVGPYTGWKVFRTNGKLVRRQTLPTGRDRARPLRGQQSRAVYGGVRLGCGFRQPNSETKFGASVMVTPPYGSATGGAQQRADVGIGPYESREI